MRDVKSDISEHFPKICKPLVVYPLYCINLFQCQTRRQMITCLIQYILYYLFDL